MKLKQCGSEVGEGGGRIYLCLVRMWDAVLNRTVMNGAVFVIAPELGF